MKKFTNKLSMKYVKLHKCRLRQDTTTEDDAGEFFRDIKTPESDRTPETVSSNNKTPKVTRIMESMQRKFKSSKDKVRQEPSDSSVHEDGRDQPRRSDDRLEERSVRNGRDRPRDQDVARRGYDLDLEGRRKNNREFRKSRSDFGSRKEYLDWIEYVEGSSHHRFDRSEDYRGAQARVEDSRRPQGFEERYRDIGGDHDHISVVQYEGSTEGNYDDTRLLKSSKNKNNEAEAPRGYDNKGRSNKFDYAFRHRLNEK